MDLLDRPEYGFLKTDSHLGKNIIFLTCGGSYAYGTGVEVSDIDIRGCALNNKADLLGMGDFEQVAADVAIKQVPLREFTSMTGELVEITRNHDKIHNRNKKKDDAHLNKHAMHRCGCI